MKLILHIGQSKTGTTALQSYLFSNKKALIEKGILYPDYYIADLPLHTLEHNSFAETLAGFNRYPRFSIEEYFKQFHKEMKHTNCHTMILSAESFFGAPQIWRLKDNQNFLDVYKQKLNNLRDFAKDFDTEIIGYFRSPEDWFESSVSHIIRYEGLFNKKLYKDDEQLLSLISPHMDYDKLLTLWHEIIQPKKMSILPYKGDTIQNFFKNIDIDISGFPPPSTKKKTHSSLDRRYIALKKQLNEIPHTKRQERVMIECLNRLNAQLPKIQKFKLDSAFREKLEITCKPCHDWMAQNYGENNQPFFSTSQNEDKSEKLTNEEIETARKEFEKLYNSLPIKWLEFKIAAKGFLRNKHPKIYAFAKNIIRH